MSTKVVSDEGGRWLRFAVWAVGFGLILGALAYLAEIGAPVFALDVLGVLALLVLGGLSRAERQAIDTPLQEAGATMTVAAAAVANQPR